MRLIQAYLSLVSGSGNPANTFSLIIGAICFVDVVAMAISILSLPYFQHITVYYYHPFLFNYAYIMCFPVLGLDSRFFFCFFFLFLFANWDPDVHGTGGLVFISLSFFQCYYHIRLATTMVRLAAIGSGLFGQ